ncbi:Hypothetical predicted protein [Paramuricea clavata]|uniref:Uncharacterized protein n=1 Tax=Paramuricea clavata TaxID=317549 RepID=A0A7D9HMG1_PARCT|nr:Hypothetical predicted protein [Paramuricea clavata]
MHSVAVEPSKELSLPFCVTNAFAHQQFMSSSYLSLTNLKESLEVYIETFKDHDNRPDSQAQWCPGWKIESYIPSVQDQLTMFINKMDEAIPYPSVCPRLNKHLLDVVDKKYGRFEFGESDPTVFSLAEVFRVQLSCGTTLEEVLEEDAIIHTLYTDSSFYTLVGQEFCQLFDIMYAKTEAVPQPFYRVVEKQEMEGKQSHDVLALRSD